MGEAQRGLGTVRRLVVKLGSQVLTTAEGLLDRGLFDWLAQDVLWLHERGVEVAIVSSGSVAAGLGRLGLAERPSSIPEVQAVAAVGQINLAWTYKEVFGAWGLPVGQVLLTRDDLENRRRYQNAKNTLSALFRRGVVPIINENDTVVVEEIKFGDNDNLSAMVTNLMEAECLIILTDTEGLYDRDPKVHADAKLLTRVDAVDDTVDRFVGASRSRMGTGGMGTKLLAARRAAHSGAAAVIATGRTPHALRRIVADETLGTYFPPMSDRLNRRKHWIAYTLQPLGTLTLDDGAVRAVRDRGTSLLPKGVTAVVGDFDRGDAVLLVDGAGQEIGRGLTGYSAQEVRKIAGLASWEIADRLGYKFYDEVIHRDDLVVGATPSANGSGGPGRNGDAPA